MDNKKTILKKNESSYLHKDYKEQMNQRDQIDHIQVNKKKKRSIGRRMIEIRYIESKTKRQSTFSKRKSGLMKKAYELMTLTGSEGLVLLVSKTNQIFCFATPQLQSLVYSQEGKIRISNCLKRSIPEDIIKYNIVNGIPKQTRLYLDEEYVKK